MKDKSFPYIATWFYIEYHKPREASESIQKLKSFKRKRYEKIYETYERYELLARQVDANFPRHERLYSKDYQIANVVIDYLLEPVRTKVQDWRTDTVEQGFTCTLPTLLTYATKLETEYKCCPTETVELTTENIHVLNNYRNIKEILTHRKHRVPEKILNEKEISSVGINRYHQPYSMLEPINPRYYL